MFDVACVVVAVESPSCIPTLPCAVAEADAAAGAGSEALPGAADAAGAAVLGAAAAAGLVVAVSGFAACADDIDRVDTASKTADVNAWFSNRITSPLVD